MNQNKTQLTEDGVGIGVMPFSTAWRNLRQKKLQELNVKGIPESWGHHDLTLCWNLRKKHSGRDLFEKTITDFFSEKKV